MPRTPKKALENEQTTSEVGLVGYTSQATGKTTWVIVRQLVTESGVVKDAVDLMEDIVDPDTGEVTSQERITFKSKALALTFLRGRLFGLSEAEESR